MVRYLLQSLLPVQTPTVELLFHDDYVWFPYNDDDEDEIIKWHYTGAQVINQVANDDCECSRSCVCEAALETLRSINFKPNPDYDLAVQTIIQSGSPPVIDARHSEYSQNWSRVGHLVTPHLLEWLAQYPQSRHFWLYDKDEVITVSALSHRLCLGVAIKVCVFYVQKGIMHVAREQWDLLTLTQAQMFLPQTATCLSELSALARKQYCLKVEALVGRDPGSLVMAYLPRDVLAETCCAAHMVSP